MDNIPRVPNERPRILYNWRPRMMATVRGALSQTMTFPLLYIMAATIMGGAAFTLQTNLWNPEGTWQKGRRMRMILNEDDAKLGEWYIHKHYRQYFVQRQKKLWDMMGIPH